VLEFAICKSWRILSKIRIGSKIRIRTKIRIRSKIRMQSKIRIRTRNLFLFANLLGSWMWRYDGIKGFGFVPFNGLNQYIFICRLCRANLGKLGKVKTTAEELVQGIPPKLMFTQTGDTFLRLVQDSWFVMYFSTWVLYIYPKKFDFSHPWHFISWIVFSTKFLQIPPILPHVYFLDILYLLLVFCFR